MIPEFFEKIENEEMELIPIDMSGLDDFDEYSQMPEFYKTFEYEPFKTKEETKKYLEKMISSVENGEMFYWFIKIKKIEKIIGTFGLRNFNQTRKSVEISYGISPKFWNKGYFKKSLKLVINYLFKEKKIHRIVSLTRLDNLPSVKGLQSLGFSQEGILRDYLLLPSNKWCDCGIFSILNHAK